MTQRRKIILSFTLPVLFGVLFLLSLVSTCERFPELILEVTTDFIEVLPGREYKLSGTIESFGREPVTQHGFCWAMSSNPTTAGDTTQLGVKNSKGRFESVISNLPASTKYYVRSYVITKAGAEYGDEKSFTTPSPSLPTLTTTDISNVTQDSAQSGGTIIDDGGSPITAKGVCWDTTVNPTIANNHTTDGNGSGGFISSVSGLKSSTTYFIRAYATNSIGAGYGSERNLTTLAEGNSVADYDGNVYETIVIGDQTWMKENLKTTHYADGSSIPLVESQSAWDALGATTKAYCWYDNSSVNRDTYGGLYTWAAAMNGASASTANPSGIQGVCPSGWHLPSDEEWKELEMHLGMSQSEADAEGWRGTDEGGKLKETGTTHWASPNTGATNESGFTALPGGYRVYDGTFVNVSDIGRWWNSSETSTNDAWRRRLSGSYASVLRNYGSKSGGFSVRCVRDF